jgi:hypothetical protein
MPAGICLRGEGPRLRIQELALQQRRAQPEDVNEPTLTALTNLGNTNAEGHIDPTQKKAIDDAMNWLRNNDPNPADVDDPTAQGLANLLPMPGGICPEEKARVVEDSVNWLQQRAQARTSTSPLLRLTNSREHQCRRAH